MNSNKKYIYLEVVALLLVIGVSLAYFGITIIGNDTAKNNKIVTGNLELTYTDTTEISLENAFPGDTFDKVVAVKNTGTKETNYSLVWTELTNEITNDELVVEATCKRLNSSGTEEGTCGSIAQTPIKSMNLKKNVLIEPNVTHEYTIKVTFIDTGEPQNYNKNKLFTGILGISEYNLPTSVSFAEDSWKTIVKLVQEGETSNYKVGDTKTIDLGATYGTHTIRIANTSTPDVCKTEGFSQSACGFVLEFADIITTHNMNPSGEYKGTTYKYGWNKDGWPATSMRTFVNNDIYNSLPSELKNGIIDTIVVSGHGSEDTENFISTDKLYLLNTAEVWADAVSSSNSINGVKEKSVVLPLAIDIPVCGVECDKARDLTRQLDYYKNLGVTTTNYSGAIKNSGTSSSIWWLRSATSDSNSVFSSVHSDGGYYYVSAFYTYGVSPAFRIG